ncbi:MAG: hypothetical protein VXW09_00495 [Pseudomonadota bacterium]|nr:hypothetical protein [Pseudomonadota bacterium]
MQYKSYLVEQNFNLLKERFVLFYGDNLGLKQDFKKKIKSYYKQNEIISFTQEEILNNETNFFNEIKNISLFETKKIYIINQANDKIIEIFKEIEQKFDDQNIYLFAEVLEKKSKLRNYFEKSKKCGSIPCYPDNELSIKKIIAERLRGYEGLTSNNINIICDNCNLDRNKLNNEIEKITIFFEDKKIETEKLQILLDVKVNDDFNLLRDEVLCGNLNKTNKLLSDTVLEQEKTMFYLAVLNNRLASLNKVNELSIETPLEVSINNLRPPIFRKDKPNFLLQARKLGKKKIKKILNETYNLEVKIKSNSIIDKNTLMKKLMVDICNLVNAS